MTVLRTTTSKRHEHVERRVRLLVQRAGVPYEIERTVCTTCSRVLAERSVGRANA